MLGYFLDTVPCSMDILIGLSRPMLNSLIYVWTTAVDVLIQVSQEFKLAALRVSWGFLGWMLRVSLDCHQRPFQADLAPWACQVGVCITQC